MATPEGHDFTPLWASLATFLSGLGVWFGSKKVKQMKASKHSEWDGVQERRSEDRRTHEEITEIKKILQCHSEDTRNRFDELHKMIHKDIADCHARITANSIMANTALTKAEIAIGGKQ